LVAPRHLKAPGDWRTPGRFAQPEIGDILQRSSGVHLVTSHFAVKQNQLDSLFLTVLAFIEKGLPFAVATVLKADGSTPVEAGAKAVIQEDGAIHGTVGGGAVVLGHLRIADHVHVSAASVVTRSIARPGNYSGFFPIDDNAAWEKNAATLKQLHSLRERLKALEKKS
jgi:hypothetical protein